MSTANPHTHLRQVYLRPSWQGGDTQQPLCAVPIFGWSGVKVSLYAMTNHPDAVTCPHCRRDIARGGIKARHERLMKAAATRESQREDAA